MKKVVDRGSRWCIGNGERVRIWKYRWIPYPELFTVISLVGTHTRMELVSSLVDVERRGLGRGESKKHVPSL